MEIPITLKGRDEASGVINSGLDKIRRESDNTSRQVAGKFKEMSIDIARNFTGSAGQIVGHLSRMPSALGLVAAAAAATGAALTRMVSDYAKENARSNAEAIKFNAHIEALKESASDLADTIASKAIPLFNNLFELFGSKVNVIAEFRKSTEEADKSLTEYLEKSRKSLAAADEEYRFALRMKQLREEQMMLEARFAAEERKRADERRRISQEIILQRLEERQQSEFGEDPLMRRLRGTQEQLEELEIQVGRTEEALDMADKQQFFDDMERDSQKAAISIQELGGTIVSSLLTALTQAKGSGQKWFDTLLGIGAGIFTRIITGGLGQAGVAGFENGGIFGRLPGAQNGMIVNRPQLLRVGENFGPEAVVPLSGAKASQREAVMAAAGLNRNVVVNLNVNGVRNIDPVTMRNRIAPMITREVRKGMNLLSSGTV